MNIEITPIESVSDIIFIFLNVLLLPLGIWILLNINYAAKKWHEKSRERAVFEYIPIFGFSIKAYTSVNWNKFIFRLIGGTCILIGGTCIAYLVLYLINIC